MTRLFLTLALCLLATNTWAAIAYHASTVDQSCDNCSTLTFNHNPGGTCVDAVDVLVVGAQDSTPGTITGATNGGSAMTAIKLNKVLSTTRALGVFKFARGSSTALREVIVSASEAMNEISASIHTFCGVDQTTINRTMYEADGVSTAMTVTVVDSTNGDVVVDGVLCLQLSTLTVGASQTQRANFLDGNQRNAMSHELATAANTVMSWTLGTSTAWGTVATALIPSTAAARRPSAPILFQ